MTDKKPDFKSSVEYDLSNSEVGLCFLEKYHLVDKIHQGMLSHVYIIEDKETQEPFILKAIRLDQCSCDLDLMKKISHPNIIKVHEAFETRKYLYLRKEFVKGITLEALINQKGPLEEKEVLEVALPLCDILAYLHSMDSSPAIYRDLKPANIMVHVSGEIKLIDLDSIRQYKEEANKDTIYIGTEGFAPPEQFGFGQTDIRSDIYTFGTTLYYLLTGQDPQADRLKLKNIREIRKDVPRSLGKIIEKCTMFHPDNRYQNVVQLQKELLGLSSDNYFMRFFYRLRLTLQKKAVLIIAGISITLTLLFLIYPFIEPGHQSDVISSQQANIPEINDNDNPPLDDNTSGVLEQRVHEIHYDEYIGASEPVLLLDKLGLDEDDIISFRLEQNGQVIPLQFDISEDKLTLINNNFPANLLAIDREYTLEITTSDNSLRRVNFVPSPQELKGMGSLRIYYIPANPAKGFHYPYFLTLPSKESLEKNKDKKNFLMVEPYDMGQFSDDLSVHLELALENAKTNSLSIAEELGLPRLVPVFTIPESTYNGKDIYTHTLSRNTILLNVFKKPGASVNVELFQSMVRIDLQLIEMTKDANEFLKKSGWTMEDQIFLWGKGASGDFANRFTFLHPELVKAAFYQSLPILPISILKDTQIPYPFGTADYKEITGNEFNLEAYNQAAKLGYIMTQDNKDPLYPDIMYSEQETERILKLLPLREYPVKWLIVKDLYVEAGLKAQVNLYEDDTLLEPDSVSFFEANRSSDQSVYNTTNDPTHAMTVIFADNKEDISGKIENEIIIQKATINEAFWTGTLPRTLSDNFIDFYTSGDAWHYNPDSFFISILEWDSLQDHRQMSDRVMIYGEEMTLKADGYKDVQVKITEGSMSSFNEGYVYFVQLVNGEDLISGVKYKLVDETGNWTVNADVTVERPIME